MLNEWQIKNAKYIAEELEDLFVFPPQPSYAESVRYIIPALCYTADERQRFLKKMVENKWEGGLPRMSISGGWTKLCSDIKFYKKFNVKGSLSMSKQLRDEAVWIDWHRYPRTDAEIDLMLEHVKEAMKEAIR